MSDTPACFVSLRPKGEADSPYAQRLKTKRFRFATSPVDRITIVWQAQCSCNNARQKQTNCANVRLVYSGAQRVDA